MSKIEWTEKTWNPIVGCSVISPGCTNCYAMKTAHRLGRNTSTPHYAGLTRDSRSGPVWTGEMRQAPAEVLTAPLRRLKPTTWFVNSMSDLFHEDVPDEWIDQVFAIMALRPRHRFQVLTKRADRMRAYLTSPDRRKSSAAYAAARHATGRWHMPDDVSLLWPLANVWLGVSAEDQTRADERIPQLLETPAAVRFVSAEPLLGPISLDTAWHGESCLDSECWGECAWCEKGYPPLWNCQRGKGEWERGRSGIDWVIVGGESGPSARPMHPDWAREIRDQCTAAGVPFFFKQWGEFVSVSEVEGPGDHHKFPDGATVRRTGKKRAGRTLDGRTWDQMPEAKQ